MSGSQPAVTIDASGRCLEMPAFKRLVAALAAEQPLRPLRLMFFGGANQITGYRLYYLLQYAKHAGVQRVTLCTDGVFWIDEASNWLIESGVDEIVVEAPGLHLDAALAARIREFKRHADAPPVRVRMPGPDAVGPPP